MKVILNSKHRNFGIDFIRAISIWCVLLYHHGFNIPGLNFFSLGGLGVEIFFVISGFLIGNILIKNLEFSNTLSSIIKFWKRRWFRILPLYYFVLLIRFILDPSIGFDILWFAFFLQSNFYEIDFFAVSWSLVIEEWFYLIAPFVLYSINLSFGKRKPILLLFFLVFLINLIRYFYYLKVDLYSAISAQFILRLDSLFIGVILVMIKLRFYKFYIKLSNLKFFTLSSLLFISYLIFIINYGDKFHLFVCTIGFSLLSILIAMIIPFIEINLKSLFFDLFTRFITLTSILTYSIYLLHPFVFYDFQNYIPNYLFTKVILTYIVSYISYIFIEIPFLKLRERI